MRGQELHRGDATDVAPVRAVAAHRESGAAEGNKQEHGEARAVREANVILGEALRGARRGGHHHGRAPRGSASSLGGGGDPRQG
jgi:hypothetical protein